MGRAMGGLPQHRAWPDAAALNKSIGEKQTEKLFNDWRYGLTIEKGTAWQGR
jgi:hypothetical protein